jgi:hypothetical protein
VHHTRQSNCRLCGPMSTDYSVRRVHHMWRTHQSNCVHTSVRFCAHISPIVYTHQFNCVHTSVQLCTHISHILCTHQSSFVHTSVQLCTNISPIVYTHQSNCRLCGPVSRISCVNHSLHSKKLPCAPNAAANHGTTLKSTAGGTTPAGRSILLYHVMMTQ